MHYCFIYKIHELDRCSRATSEERWRCRAENQRKDYYGCGTSAMIHTVHSPQKTPISEIISVDVKEKRSKLGHAPNTYYNAHTSWIEVCVIFFRARLYKRPWRCGRMVSIPASCYKNHGFKSRPGFHYTEWGFKWISPVSLGKFWNSTLILGSAASFNILSK